MGFLDRLLGRQSRPQAYQPRQQPGYAPAPQGYGQQGYGQQPAQGQSEQDRQALARYRYLLQTAPPEKIEQAHAEAFAQLTPEQRQQVLQGLAQSGERPVGDDPQNLARAATRAELRQPGFMERTFGGYGGRGMGMGMGGGIGMGGMFMGSMLGSIAGMVVGTAIAESMMDGFDQWDHDTDGGQNFADGDYDQGDQGVDQGDQYDASGVDTQGYDDGSGFADSGYSDSGFSDSGFGGGDSFGDFGGGDFGGGDFGGGDFGGGF